MERSVIAEAFILTVLISFCQNVATTPDPQEFQWSSFCRVGKSAPNSGIATNPSLMNAANFARHVLAAEGSSTRKGEKEVLQRSSDPFLTSPSKWFLPTLRKWPNFPSHLRVSQGDIFADQTGEIGAFPENDQPSVNPPGIPQRNNSWFVPRTLSDEWHPRYTPISSFRHQPRLLRILG